VVTSVRFSFLSLVRVEIMSAVFALLQRCRALQLVSGAIVGS
jgi:hypothetical protein